MRLKKLWSSLLVVLMLLGFGASCSSKKANDISVYFDQDTTEISQGLMPKKGEKVAVITTDKGEMKMRLFPEAAPKSVENFVTLVEESFYTGISFERFEPNFLLQIGATAEYPHGKSIFGDFFEDELEENFFHLTGAVGIANASSNQNGSIFYIITREELLEEDLETLEKNETGYSQELVDAYKNMGGVPRLDMKHTIFGQIYEGFDVLYKIADPENNNHGERTMIYFIEIEIVE